MADQPMPGVDGPVDLGSPGYLKGVNPEKAGSYTVNPCELLPAANLAETNADTLQRLSFGLAMGMPAGLGGFQTGWQAGTLADAWSREVGAIATAARICGAKIRTTTDAYLRAEGVNTAKMG